MALARLRRWSDWELCCCRWVPPVGTCRRCHEHGPSLTRCLEGQTMSASRSEADAVGEAAELMDGFAERTGLTSALPPKRYLWTDAFAVCNFLALQRASGDARQGE